MSLEATKRIAGSSALAAVAVFGFAVWFVFDHLASTPPPAQLVANPGDGHVTLRWHIEDGETGITGWKYQQYQLKREGVVEQGWRRIPDEQAAEGSYRVKNLTNGWTYVFRVRAVHDRVHGTPSNEAVATPEAECPRGCRRQPTQRLTLAPVHLLVHFRNAELAGPYGDLSGAGVVLEPVHQLMLRTTVKTLAACATPGNPVRIRPYGFASSAPFAGRDDSDELNVRAANWRAREVHEKLRLLSHSHVPDVRVEEPPEWETFDEMVAERNACIPSPSPPWEWDRDSFLDRAVVLTLPDPGSCAAAADFIRCRTSDVADPRNARSGPQARQFGWLTGAGRAGGTGG